MSRKPEKKRISTVYTGVGDQGKTQLVDGSWVDKTHPIVEAVGEVDELNSLLGLVLSQNPPPPLDQRLRQIQNDLFILGADLASPPELQVPRITENKVRLLEQWIDDLNAQLPMLREFILPGGHPLAALLFLARAVARRAERRIAHLLPHRTKPFWGLVYINRLSDLLFVAARWVNRHHRQEEPYVDFQA